MDPYPHDAVETAPDTGNAQDPDLPVPRPRGAPWLPTGLRAGAVAAAATSGVLVRVGMTEGIGPFGAFAQVGRLATGVTAVDPPLAQHAATIAGVVLHVMVVTLWALLLAGLARRWRGAAVWLAAAAVALLAWAAGITVLPAVLRLGHGARALPPQLLLLHVVLALSLAVGMRLALEAADDPRHLR